MFGIRWSARGRRADENHGAISPGAEGLILTAERAPMPMLLSDPNRPGSPIIFANESFHALTGYDRSAVLGRNFDFLLGPETDPVARTRIDETFTSPSPSFGAPEVRCYKKNGSSFWAVVFIGPVLDAKGRVVQHFVSLLDITARRREERRMRLLLNELNHRTQNTLATVQAIALQTLGGVTEESALEAFEMRLLALSTTHRLLGGTDWEAASLKSIFNVILEPFGLRDDHRKLFLLEGEDVRMPPKMALTFGLVFQELATNASKYGALSRPCGGRVQISWQAASSLRGDLLKLRWQEFGGPPVMPPGPDARRGFGSMLIEGGLAKELRGEVRLDYEPAGLVCEFILPYPQIERPL
jgi:PAS domain S-box-containing protein